MMAIVTETGMSHRSSVFLAALYQDLFSLKILQTSFDETGGPDEAQAVIKKRDKKHISYRDMCLIDYDILEKLK